MRTVSKKDLIDYAYSLDLSKKGQKDRQAFALHLAHGMSDTMTLECKIDWNLGQLGEAFVKAEKFGLEHARFAKCNDDDLKYKNGTYEIKISTSANCLSTPLPEPVRTIFISKHGAVLLSKAVLEKIFDDPWSFEEYVRIKDGGLAFKTAIAEIGKPIKWLNEVLGY